MNLFQKQLFVEFLVVNLSLFRPVEFLVEVKITTVSSGEWKIVRTLTMLIYQFQKKLKMSQY